MRGSTKNQIVDEGNHYQQRKAPWDHETGDRSGSEHVFAWQKIFLQIPFWSLLITLIISHNITSHHTITLSCLLRGVVVTFVAQYAFALAYRRHVPRHEDQSVWVGSSTGYYD